MPDAISEEWNAEKTRERLKTALKELTENPHVPNHILFAVYHALGALARAAAKDAREADAITEYWSQHYVTPSGHCALCGNHGIIDREGLKTPAGYPLGTAQFCICPNGQALRAQRAALVGDG